MYNLVFTTQEKFNDYFLENNEKPLEYLPKTNKVNLLIGANNSGKSFFMRKLMELKELYQIHLDFVSKYNENVNEFNNNVNSLGNNISPEQLLVKINLDLNFHLTIDRNLSKLKNNRFRFSENYESELQRLEKHHTKSIIINNKYFIPTMRTAHSLFQIDDENPKKINKIQNDIYEQTLLKNYPSLKNNVEIFTGLNLYEQILSARNSNKQTREKFQEFENFLSEHFFNKKQIDIVAEFKYKESKIGNNESELILIHIEGEKHTQKLYELGDGIQALIILMYKIFMAENDSFVFIDEPELNLHPGMQRLFSEQILTNKFLKEKNLTYFISTHSNHFLDLSIEKDDISIYSFSTRLIENGEKQFIIKNVNSGNNELLRNLGVNNSSVFMANCSIWVEGISDRNYIKAFLKSYCEANKKPYPKEDIDFAFFEYAGSNYLHYNFSDEINKNKIKAFALNNRILFLSDVDNNKEEKHKILKDLAKANFQYETTGNYREMENILPNAVWEKVLINFRDQRKYKEDIDGVIQSKISNALKKNNYEDYKDKYIGVFLKKLKIEELNKIWEGSDTTPKTFSYKAELSNLVLEKVLNNEIKWDDFKHNSIIVELTEKIYNFICEK